MLIPLEPREAFSRPFTKIIQPIVDPKEPLDAAAAAQQLWSLKMLLSLGVPIVFLVLLSLAWRYTSFGSYAGPDLVSGLVDNSPLAPLNAIVTFVVGGLVMFPVLVLIAATAIVFGPWLFRETGQTIPSRNLPRRSGDTRSMRDPLSRKTATMIRSFSAVGRSWTNR